MRSILCFGDSNTWGYIPGTAGRYPFEQRWPGILQQKLGTSFRVIEEGLNGRTTVWEDPFQPGRKGTAALPMLLETHKPLDLVVIMLGTNDLKPYHNVSAEDIARGVSVLGEMVLASQTGPDGHPPQLLIIAPPVVSELGGEMKAYFPGAVEKSAEFAEYYVDTAEELKAHYLDAAEFAAADPSEGVHLNQEAHQNLGHAVADKISVIFSGGKVAAESSQNVPVERVPIESVNHIGIRVKDRDRSVAFYKLLGFSVERDGFDTGHPVVMKHDSGVTLNLLGPTTVAEDKNILMDVKEKYAGITHMALTVKSLPATRKFMEDHDILITGSFSFGNMSAIFIRDPDRNVIELDGYD
ncbi:GDSL-type esterase/lipase family protein [Endozoicomonadaceae bacterium StTr2]